MKKSLYALLTTTVLLLTSCGDNNNTYPNRYYSMGTVQKSGKSLDFMSDDGILITPQKDLPWNDSIKNGDRLYFEFDSYEDDFLAEDHWNGHVVTYAKVKISPVIDIETKNDTLYDQSFCDVKAIWLSNDYINAVIYNFVTIEKKNSFDLVRYTDKDDVTRDGVPVINLRLKHNTASLNYLYYEGQYRSYDLRPIKQEFAAYDTIFIDFAFKLGEREHSNRFKYAIN